MLKAKVERLERLAAAMPWRPGREMTEAEARQFDIDFLFKPALGFAERVGRGELPGDAEPSFTLSPEARAEARALGVLPDVLAEVERRLSAALRRCAALAVKAEAPGENSPAFERDFWAWRQGCGAA